MRPRVRVTNRMARDMMTLWEIGFTLKEIAAVSGVSYNTVYRYIWPRYDEAQRKANKKYYDRVLKGNESYYTRRREYNKAYYWRNKEQRSV